VCDATVKGRRSQAKMPCFQAVRSYSAGAALGSNRPRPAGVDTFLSGLVGTIDLRIILTSPPIRGMNAMANERPRGRALERENMPKTKKTSTPGKKRRARPKAVIVKKAQPSNSARPGAPAEREVADRRETKTDRVLALLMQPSGATLKAIMDATGWQSRSVRGFISGQVVKKMGLRVKSFRRDGERVYSLKG
jgi:hypothetical protein